MLRPPTRSCWPPLPAPPPRGRFCILQSPSQTATSQGHLRLSLPPCLLWNPEPLCTAFIEHLLYAGRLLYGSEAATSRGTGHLPLSLCRAQARPGLSGACPPPPQAGRASPELPRGPSSLLMKQNPLWAGGGDGVATEHGAFWGPEGGSAQGEAGD